MRDWLWTVLLSDINGPISEWDFDTYAMFAIRIVVFFAPSRSAVRFWPPSGAV
jgi:hypothetical protein